MWIIVIAFWILAITLIFLAKRVSNGKLSREHIDLLSFNGSREDGFNQSLNGDSMNKSHGGHLLEKSEAMQSLRISLLWLEFLGYGIWFLLSSMIDVDGEWLYWLDESDPEGIICSGYLIVRALIMGVPPVFYSILLHMVAANSYTHLSAQKDPDSFFKLLKYTICTPGRVRFGIQCILTATFGFPFLANIFQAKFHDSAWFFAYYCLMFLLFRWKFSKYDHLTSEFLKENYSYVCPIEPCEITSRVSLDSVESKVNTSNTTRNEGSQCPSGVSDYLYEKLLPSPTMLQRAVNTLSLSLNLCSKLPSSLLMWQEQQVENDNEEFGDQFVPTVSSLSCVILNGNTNESSGPDSKTVTVSVRMHDTARTHPMHGEEIISLSEPTKRKEEKDICAIDFIASDSEDDLWEDKPGLDLPPFPVLFGESSNTNLHKRRVPGDVLVDFENMIPTESETFTHNEGLGVRQSEFLMLPQSNGNDDSIETSLKADPGMCDTALISLMRVGGGKNVEPLSLSSDKEGVSGESGMVDVIESERYSLLRVINSLLTSKPFIKDIAVINSKMFSRFTTQEIHSLMADVLVGWAFRLRPFSGGNIPQIDNIQYAGSTSDSSAWRRDAFGYLRGGIGPKIAMFVGFVVFLLEFYVGYGRPNIRILLGFVYSISIMIITVLSRAARRDSLLHGHGRACGLPMCDARALLTAWQKIAVARLEPVRRGSFANSSCTVQKWISRVLLPDPLFESRIGRIGRAANIDVSQIAQVLRQGWMGPSEYYIEGTHKAITQETSSLFLSTSPIFQSLRPYLSRIVYYLPLLCLSVLTSLFGLLIQNYVSWEFGAIGLSFVYVVCIICAVTFAVLVFRYSENGVLRFLQFVVRRRILRTVDRSEAKNLVDGKELSLQDCVHLDHLCHERYGSVFCGYYPPPSEMAQSYRLFSYSSPLRLRLLHIVCEQWLGAEWWAEETKWLSHLNAFSFKGQKPIGDVHPPSLSGLVLSDKGELVVVDENLKDKWNEEKERRKKEILTSTTQHRFNLAIPAHIMNCVPTPLYTDSSILDYMWDYGFFNVEVPMKSNENEVTGTCMVNPVTKFWMLSNDHMSDVSLVNGVPCVTDIAGKVPHLMISYGENRKLNEPEKVPQIQVEDIVEEENDEIEEIGHAAEFAQARLTEVMVTALDSDDGIEIVSSGNIHHGIRKRNPVMLKTPVLDMGSDSELSDVDLAPVKIPPKKSVTSRIFGHVGLDFPFLSTVSLRQLCQGFGSTSIKERHYNSVQYNQSLLQMCTPTVASHLASFPAITRTITRTFTVSLVISLFIGIRLIGSDSSGLFVLLTAAIYEFFRVFPYLKVAVAEEREALGLHDKLVKNTLVETLPVEGRRAIERVEEIEEVFEGGIALV